MSTYSVATRTTFSVAPAVTTSLCFYTYGQGGGDPTNAVPSLWNRDGLHVVSSTSNSDSCFIPTPITNAKNEMSFSLRCLLTVQIRMQVVAVATNHRGGGGAHEADASFVKETYTFVSLMMHLR